jgi:hypothetical protein
MLTANLVDCGLRNEEQHRQVMTGAATQHTKVPHAVSGAAIFLCSDAARYVTGHAGRRRRLDGTVAEALPGYGLVTDIAYCPQ